MTNFNTLEELRTKEELVNYFEEKGQNITEEEIEALKKSYEQAENENGALTMQQLDDVAGGVTKVFEFFNFSASAKFSGTISKENFGSKNGGLTFFNGDDVATHFVHCEGKEDDNVCQVYCADFWHLKWDGKDKAVEKIQQALESITPDTDVQSLIDLAKSAGIVPVESRGIYVNGQHQFRGRYTKINDADRAVDNVREKLELNRAGMSKPFREYHITADKEKPDQVEVDSLCAILKSHCPSFYFSETDDLEVAYGCR